MTAIFVMLIMFVVFPVSLLMFGLEMEKWANRNDERYIKELVDEFQELR